MRIVHQITAVLGLGLFLSSCSSSYSSYAYDDLYYSPNNDPVREVQKDPREDFNKTNNITYQNNNENRYAQDEKPADYPQSVYRNRYTETEQLENSQIQPADNNNQSYDDEYYNEDYAESLQRMSSPVRSFNTYDPYQRDRILYTYDPFFTAPTVYGSYRFWDPFVPSTGLSVGWNSFSGWNVGIYSGFGFGYGGFGYRGFNCVPLNPYYGYYDPFFDPFWGSPWRYGNFYSPYYGYGFYGGYNNYAWGFNNGYNAGYYNGRNYGNYNAYTGTDGVRRTSGRRQTSVKRGSSGSGVAPTSNQDRTTRRPTGIRSGSSRTASPATQPNSTRPTRRQDAPKQSEVNPNIRPSRSSTPTKYSTPKTPESYSRPRSTPSNNNRPAVTTPPAQNNTRPSYTRPQQEAQPNYSRPQRQNSYNRPSTQPKPQQAKPQYSRPQQNQSRPSYNNNRSRPSYNNSRSTPTYTSPSRSTPSRNSGGGGSRRPSRR